MKMWIFDMGLSYLKSRAIDIINPRTNIEDNLDFKMFPEIIANLGIAYHLKKSNTDFYLNTRYMANQYDTHYDQVPYPDIKPEKLQDYFRTDLNVSSQIRSNLQIDLDITNLFNKKNETGAAWGNRNREGHEEYPISAMLSLRYTH